VAKKKKLSGAQGKKRRALGLANEVGRPCGSVRMLELYRDIVHRLWEGSYWWGHVRQKCLPVDWIYAWEDPKKRAELIRALKKEFPERYEHLTDSMLGRYLSELRRYLEELRQKE
jgi:hypothetical protein